MKPVLEVVLICHAVWARRVHRVVEFVMDIFHEALLVTASELGEERLVCACGDLQFFYLGERFINCDGSLMFIFVHYGVVDGGACALVGCVAMSTRES